MIANFFVNYFETFRLLSSRNSFWLHLFFDAAEKIHGRAPKRKLQKSQLSDIPLDHWPSQFIDPSCQKLEPLRRISKKGCPSQDSQTSWPHCSQLTWAQTQKLPVKEQRIQRVSFDHEKILRHVMTCLCFEAIDSIPRPAPKFIMLCFLFCQRNCSKIQNK